MVIKTRVLCMNSPVGSRQLVAARVYTLSQCAMNWKVKTQPRRAKASPPSASSAPLTRPA
jgi:hypothetical protein